MIFGDHHTSQVNPGEDTTAEMKWILITLAIGLAASDKLDRTYLPPPGATFSGGILGSQDAPLEVPHHIHSGINPGVGGHEGPSTNFGINGDQLNFGDKIPKVPVTTTSYAFSQTTIYPPGQGFETTALPINPITGLPIQLPQENFQFGLQGQLNNLNLPSATPSQTTAFGSNIQTGFGPKGLPSAPVKDGRPGNDQFNNLPLEQYSGQSVISPEDTLQIPGSVYPGQNQGMLQYPSGQDIVGQQGFLPAGAPDSQRFDQYPGRNVVNPGNVIQIPGSNEGVGQRQQYPVDQTVVAQQGFEPLSGSPITLQPSSNQYGVKDDGSQRTYTVQPINVPNLGSTQPGLLTYQPINVGSPSQYPSANQNYGTSIPTGSANIYQPGSTASSIPSSVNSGFPNTTPFPNVPSSTSLYSSNAPVYRPKRPQAEADRNAVILNYENVRTPNGYSYSFDTSNGIHADENGIIDNGTKAQGSYSYIGDDGKVYSVIYTADENGFQPRGDHLPTSPPIPEAIQRVIEQAARDKAAGIVHDGFYDEAKYGDKQYQVIENHHGPQNQYGNQFGNGQVIDMKNDLSKPIVGLKDTDYDEGIAQDHFNDNLPVSGTRKDTNGKLSAGRPSNQLNIKNNSVIGDFELQKTSFERNGMPISENGNNQQNNYDIKKQRLEGQQSGSIGTNIPLDTTQSLYENNLPEMKNRKPSNHRPIFGGAKDVTEKYPGSNVEVTAAGNFSETKEDGLGKSQSQNIGSGSPDIPGGSVVNMFTNFDRVTDGLIENEKQGLRQKVTGNQRSHTTSNIYDAGYHYQQPNEEFEQNSFPNRFSSQKVSSTTNPKQHKTEFIEGTTLRPFMTKNVYDNNERDNQTTPYGYKQNNMNSQSITRRPFTTIGVSFPSDKSYTDYDDGHNYETNQDIGDDRTSSNRYPTEKVGVTSRPYQPTQTTSRPQNVPGRQRTRTNQKGTVVPGRETETSGTLSPGYTYGRNTEMPSNNLRFGSTVTPQKLTPQQRRPLNIDSSSTAALGSSAITAFPSGTRPIEYKYQTTGPNSNYAGQNIGANYPTIGTSPGSGSILASPEVPTPQDYYTSTYAPAQSNYSTTAIPSTYEYTQGPNSGSRSQVPFDSVGSFQPSMHQSFHTGYHYGPPKTGAFNPDDSGFFTPTTNTAVFPTSSIPAYQTTYQQGGGFPTTNLGPVTPGQQSTFITSQSGTVAPDISPSGINQENYQNRPSTPDYSTIVSSTPGGKPVFRYPGSPGTQLTNGYEFEPTRPSYSTTESLPTIGTTPGSFLPSEATNPPQRYSSTTYRPGFQTSKDTFVDGPVDGFGRSINTDQGSTNPGFSHLAQGPNFDGTDQSIQYPGSYDETRVIGEDFSGPKQTQRFDPKTGYHYK